MGKQQEKAVGCNEPKGPAPSGKDAGPQEFQQWSFQVVFADFQPLVGQGLPELGASLFSSPQGGMFMEEKPKPPQGPV